MIASTTVPIIGIPASGRFSSKAAAVERKQLGHHGIIS
jgi:hypothetical protein